MKMLSKMGATLCFVRGLLGSCKPAQIRPPREMPQPRSCRRERSAPAGCGGEGPCGSLVGRGPARSPGECRGRAAADARATLEQPELSRVGSSSSSADLQRAGRRAGARDRSDLGRTVSVAAGLSQPACRSPETKGTQ